MNGKIMGEALNTFVPKQEVVYTIPTPDTGMGIVSLDGGIPYMVKVRFTHIPITTVPILDSIVFFGAPQVYVGLSDSSYLYDMKWTPFVGEDFAFCQLEFHYNFGSGTITFTVLA